VDAGSRGNELRTAAHPPRLRIAEPADAPCRRQRPSQPHCVARRRASYCTRALPALDISASLVPLSDCEPERAASSYTECGRRAVRDGDARSPGQPPKKPGFSGLAQLGADALRAPSLGRADVAAGYGHWLRKSLIPGGYPLLTCSMAEVIRLYFGIVMAYRNALKHDLGEEAAGLGGVSRSSFVAGTLRELSRGLCRCNLMAYRASLGVLARSSGSGFRPGLSLPTDGHVE
jgi:hypothetical protein